MEKQKNILIIAGEASGDLHAAKLVKAIKEIDPALRVWGVGGNLMRETGVEIFHDINDLSAIGLFDVLKKLPLFLALKKKILHEIQKNKPEAIILVDFSGFNLRLAKAINNDTPVIYYISPQVWASRPGRIDTIKKYISRMIVILPFEKEFYKKYGLDVEFVGHPLLDIVGPSMPEKDFFERFGLTPGKPLIALLPGSRPSEVKQILPVMIKTCSLINKSMPQAQFVIAKPASVNWGIYNRLISGADIDLKIIQGYAYDCITDATFCLVASGTATLETAIMGRPFVIIYKMSLLNYLLYRPQVKLPHIGLVNILADKRIIPEFIQFKAKPQDISREVLKIMQSPDKISNIKSGLKQIKQALGEKGAVKKAAQIITDFLDENREFFNLTGKGDR